MSPDFSIVMEFENASTHDATEVVAIFAALLRQFEGREPVARGELILVFDPSTQTAEDIDHLVDSSARKLRDHLTIKKLTKPGLRYYEMKNAGAEVADGGVLIFLDSDTIPEDGWLRNILSAFANTNTVAVNGHVYLGHYDFVSRVFALTWMFPLRDDNQRELRRRALNANNCAFRRSWFEANPFPNHDGFKVSCSLLSDEMRRQGIDLVRVPALARHEPLEGWRFLCWRAAVAGRDENARYVALRSGEVRARILRALVRWVKQLLRSARRIVTRRHMVKMPIYEVLPAIVLAWVYYTIFFVAQLRSAVSPPRREPEKVPGFVVHS